MKAFDKYAAEAKEKWGQTPAYKEYEARGYSKEKQTELADETDNLMERFALCKKQGNAPDSAPAQALVQALQDHITEHYYLCTKQLLSGLGQMYVGDERFKDNIDKHGIGTAIFICEAITVYCTK